MLTLVGGEYEYEYEYDIVQDIAVLYQQASICIRQGFVIF